MLKNTNETYGSVTKWLHWLIAILVIGMLILGLVLTQVEKGVLRNELMWLHKSIGMTVLLIVVFRILWRFSNRQPTLPLTVPLWEQTASRFMHFLLYLVLFAMPISGWMMSSFGGHPVIFWGWFDAALPLGQYRPWAHQFSNAHFVIAWVMTGLIIVHTTAALKHHFIDKDYVLRRMLPGFKPTHLFRE